MYLKPLITILIVISLLFLNQVKNAAIGITIPKEEIKLLKTGFEGSWLMQTIVTKSSCPYIPVGSTTKSKLEIRPYINSNKFLKALWKGGEWKQSKGIVRLLNSHEAITERVTEIRLDDKNNWKAVLIDHLKLDEENKMYSESIVIQYKNDNIVGEYSTYSILKKQNTTD